MKKQIVSLIICSSIQLILLQQSAYTQFTKQVGVQLVYDDNAFSNYSQITDYSTEFSWYLARDFVSSTNFEHRLFYDGYANLYKTYSSRFSHYHTFGYAAALSALGKGDILSLGTNIALNRRTEYYEYSNFTQAIGFINYKLWPVDNLISQLGYRARYRSYHNLPELSHLEHHMFGRFSYFLPSKTSVIANVSLGVKNYKPYSYAVEYETNGRGSRTMTSTVTEDNTTLRQVRLGVRIGQAIAAGTGVSLNYMQRINLGEQKYFGENQYVVLFKEEDIFDDPYSYSGYDAGISITKLLPWQLKSSFGFEFRNKKYDTDALDLTGESLESPERRHDQRSQFWLTIRKSFKINHTLNNVGLLVRMLYMVNRSNDLYFDYTNFLISTGMDFNF